MRNSEPPGVAGSRRGFTLIETLVAFVILALSLGAIFSIFSNSLQAVQLGADRAHALALAQSRLAVIDMDGMSGIGVTSGEDESGYRWRADIHDMPDPPFETGESGAVPVEIVVTVSWGGARSRSVELTTLRVMRQ